MALVPPPRRRSRFLGEQRDITDPEAAMLVARQTMERPCSVRQQPDSQQPLGAEDVVDSHLGKVVVSVCGGGLMSPTVLFVHPVSTPSTEPGRALYFELHPVSWADQSTPWGEGPGRQAGATRHVALSDRRPCRYMQNGGSDGGVGLQLHGGIAQRNAPDPSQVEPSANDREMVADFESVVARREEHLARTRDRGDEESRGEARHSQCSTSDL